MQAELRKLVKLWAGARAAGEECALATVVGVQGSSYRKPGARMLIARSGRRAGTVSGGCLEAEVAKKIWWLTENGPAVKDYSTSYDDDAHPSYGLGCDGVVSLLLERASRAEEVFAALQAAVVDRIPSAIVTVTGTHGADARLGARLALPQTSAAAGSGEVAPELLQLLLPIARDALRDGRSKVLSAADRGERLRLFAECIAPPPALFVFGAGDDAQPLVRLADAMGWEVTVADGRSNLAAAARFPSAGRVAALDPARPLAGLRIAAGDAAVVMTHSYAQDVGILRELLPLRLAYLGVLGPKRRTARIVDQAAERAGVDPARALKAIKSPVGLDLGAGSPQVIALSIAAEIQAVLSRRSAAPLCADASADMPLAAAIHD